MTIHGTTGTTGTTNSKQRTDRRYRLLLAEGPPSKNKGNSMPPKYNPLTHAEERVIVHKGTERPFAGEYTHTQSPGTYVCRR